LHARPAFSAPWLRTDSAGRIGGVLGIAGVFIILAHTLGYAQVVIVTSEHTLKVLQVGIVFALLAKDSIGTLGTFNVTAKGEYGCG